MVSPALWPFLAGRSLASQSPTIPPFSLAVLKQHTRVQVSPNGFPKIQHIYIYICIESERESIRIRVASEDETIEEQDVKLCGAQTQRLKSHTEALLVPRLVPQTQH